MAGSLGSLVVRLGLDAAEFTSGLTKAEYQARKFGESIGSGIRSSALVGAAAVTSIGAAALAANAAFNKLLDGAAKFQDLAEETGASAEGIAGLAVAAGTAGVSIESVAGATIKLTKSLVGVDDESKAAGAALAALGLNVKDFKTLDPVAQYEAVSKALAGFADGAGKTAVAVALFGKSGAEQLKVLKALEEQGGRTTILTSEQIAKADEYRDAQAKLTAEIGLYASAVATEFIGPTTELKRIAFEAAKELFGLSGEVSGLGNNNGVRDFAQNSAVALVAFTERIATVVNAMGTVGRTAQLLGSSARLAVEAASAATPGGLAAGATNGFKGLRDAYEGQKEAVANLSKSYQATIEKAKGAESKKLRELFNTQNSDQALNSYYGIKNQRSTKPALAFDGSEKKGKKDNSAAQEAKAQLAADLDAIKNAQEAVTNSYANQEKILEALRSAGLKDESTYYQEKQRLLAQTTTAQEDALQKQIARLQQEKLSGKDAIDNTKKIADAQAALTKVQENGATQARVLEIQQTAAYKKIESSILSARQAAQDFFDTTNRGYSREIAGIGQGSKARSLSSGVTQIEDKYRQQRQDLQNQRAQAELAGTFTPDAAKQFNAQLDIINEFQSKAIDSYKAYYDTIDDAQKNWLNGATEALHNYADEASNVAKHTEEAFTNAFKGLEDQFTNLLSGKKFDGKKLLEELQGDLTRNFVKENITGPLASLGTQVLGFDLFGGKGGGKRGDSASNPLFVKSADPLTGLGGSSLGGSSGGLLGSIFSAASSAYGGFSGSTAASLANVSGGGLDDLLKYAGNFAGRAGGGNVSPFSIHRVNENGPELLDYQGKQYLMNGARNAQVTANHRIADGNGFTQSNTFILPNRSERQTQSQIAAKVRRQSVTVASRF